MAVENLKEIWQNQSTSKIQFSETDIYKMIQKKSASIVKWIFYISIIEFVIFVIPTIFMDNSMEEVALGLDGFIKIVNIINYVFVVPFFIFLFYKNHQSICVDTNSKKLIKDILKTKKTVTYYVYSQLVIAGLVLFVMLYKFSSNEVFLSQLPKNTNMTLIWLVFIIVILFFLVLIWFIYKLIYGILLKKLNTNYKELLKSEH